LGHSQDLAREDAVRVVQLVAIGLEDAVELVGVAVEAPGDARQRVAGDQGLEVASNAVAMPQMPTGSSTMSNGCGWRTVMGARPDT
jgi:hypothetical protein